MFIKPLLDFEDKSLKNFFYCNTQLMLITDTEIQSVLAINHSAVKTFGFDKEKIMSDLFTKIVLQKQHQKLVTLAAETISAGEAAKKEISLINGSGKLIYAEVVINPILFDNKEAFLLTMNDVTEKRLYRKMLEDAVGEEIELKNENRQLKKIAFKNFRLARKPLANILGLVNVLDQSVLDQSISPDQTLAEAIEFLRECSNELDEMIKNIDPALK